MPARFVILHHTGFGCEHWDLMIEHGNALLTWQLFHEPAGVEALPIHARKIADHRKHYLEYEGPVSGGRGTVRRVDAGPAEIEKFTASRCRVALDGQRLRGRFTLSRRSGGDWRLTATSDAG